MLAASSGMDMRGVLRTLRPVGRSTSRDSGTKIRFLVGSAASSGIAAAVLTARASVWVTAFMVYLQSSETREWRGTAPPAGERFRLSTGAGHRPASRGRD